MNAVMADPIRCPVVWPYRLSEDTLDSYLTEVRTILAERRFRSRDREGWSERAAELIHKAMRLATDWSVLPLRSGTDALALALRAVDVRAGDEVAIPDLAPFRFRTDEQGGNPTQTVDRFAEHLGRHGIAGRSGFPPQSSHFGLGQSQPIAARLYRETLCLPTGASMPLEWVDEVADRLAEAS
jgi:dTDP-4-amino-4,6-dideoxygalactose transaminase